MQAAWLLTLTLHDILQAYYRDAVGGFVVYDVTQRISLEHCLQWKKEINDVVQLSNGDSIPIVLIANKVLCELKFAQNLNELYVHRLTVVDLMVKNLVEKMALLVILKLQQRQELELKKPYILW